MPFKSDAQRKYLFAKEPKVAKEFAEATPKGAELPEHVSHMAEGGEIPPDENMMQKLVKHFLGSSIGSDQRDANAALHVDDAPALQAGQPTLEDMAKAVAAQQTATPQPPTEAAMAMKQRQALGMADGGVPGVTFMENQTPEQTNKTVHLAAPAKMAEGGPILKAHDRNPEPAKTANVDVSHEEKLKAIYKAMGMQRYADGGMVGDVDPSQLPNPAAAPMQNDPSYWDKIKAALAQVSAPITGAAHALTVPLQTAATAAAPLVPPAVSAINRLTGTSLPVPEPTASPMADLAPSMPPVAPAPAPMAPAAMPPIPNAVAPAPKLDNLFNQDTSKLTEGVNPEDRQNLANKLQGDQHGIGSILAQAIAGLGDAVAAKGGREQHSLQNIFSMQKDQRTEALANFDKARQDRLQKIDLQTKLGTNAVNAMAAKDAYGVDEHANKLLGAPPGTMHKDLPLYLQMKSAEVASQEKDADLYMKAHTQAAADIDGAIKNSSVLGIKPSPAQLQASGAKLADQYYNRAKGNVLFQPSDGQKSVWIPAKNIGKARQMDPHGQIVP